MNTEQKAKAYDEALEKAKDFYKGYKQRDNQLYANDLETIFPELTKSEDEKIRQKFIKLVKMSNEVGGFALHKWESDEMLAWLEKQGEKSVNKLQVSGKLYEHIRNTCACIDDALSSETLADINDYLSMAERSAQSALNMIEKQGEQKDVLPIPTRETVLAIWELGNKWRGLTEGSIFEIGNQLEYIQKHWQESTYYLTVKQSEQKSYMIEALHTEYEKGRADTIAEMEKDWSEEDEHLSYWTIHNLTELKNRFGENYGDSGKCIDWLKQLKQRHTWKPSEEQIECLHDAINHYHTNGYPASKLSELYEQMSKIYKL